MITKSKTGHDDNDWQSNNQSVIEIVAPKEETFEEMWERWVKTAETLQNEMAANGASSVFVADRLDMLNAEGFQTDLYCMWRGNAITVIGLAHLMLEYLNKPYLL
jgi:hypothetical protein